MGQFLGPIMRLCKANNWPPLTVLVVNQATGLPSEGLITLENVNNVNEVREAVFKFDWFSIDPPQVKDFESMGN